MEAESELTKMCDVFTEADLARVFTVSLKTVQNWRRKGSIDPTGYTPGNKPVYSRAYVRDLLDNPIPHRSIS